VVDIGEGKPADTCISPAGVVVTAVIAAVVAFSLAATSPDGSQPRAQSPPGVTGSASPTASSTVGPVPGRTWTETTYTQSKTFTDYLNAGYPSSALLKPRQVVQVSCRVRGFAVQDGDPWWYQLASPPRDRRHYVTSDVFYNTPSASGNPINGIVVDKRVRVLISHPHPAVATYYLLTCSAEAMPSHQFREFSFVRWRSGSTSQCRPASSVNRTIMRATP
jgi:hypothetical protein